VEQRLQAARPERWHAAAGRAVMSQIDRRIAAIAHLSIGFGVVVGVGFLLGLAINLVIWLRSKRSPFVELHAEQAGAYQLVVLLTNILLVALGITVVVACLADLEVLTRGLSVKLVLMGIWVATLPLQIGWFFGTIFLGIYAGIVVAAGGDFSYPIFGPWARRRMAVRGGLPSH
jgi:uncharacterized Tic20 family protein